MTETGRSGERAARPVATGGPRGRRGPGGGAHLPGLIQVMPALLSPRALGCLPRGGDPTWGPGPRRTLRAAEINTWDPLIIPLTECSTDTFKGIELNICDGHQLSIHSILFLMFTISDIMLYPMEKCVTGKKLPIIGRLVG